MTQNKKQFILYKNMANKIIKIICDNNMSSYDDMEAIFHIIMGWPLRFSSTDENGKYVENYIWNGNFYEAFADVPEQGQKDFQTKYSPKERVSDQIQQIATDALAKIYKDEAIQKLSQELQKAIIEMDKDKEKTNV
mgnify:CR=1 FL=1